MPRFATTKLAMTQKGFFHKTHLDCRTILRIAVGLSWFGGVRGGSYLVDNDCPRSPNLQCLPKAQSYLPKDLLYWILASPYPLRTPLAARYIARQYRAGYAHIPHLAAILGFGVWGH